MRRMLVLLIISSLCLGPVGWAKGKKGRGGDTAIGVEYVGMKAKGGWTAVVVAIQNRGTTDATLQCCEAFLENGAGYSVPALSADEMAVLIHNKAKAAATIGALVSAGLGIAGAVSGNNDLVYAATGVGVASGVAGVAGEASADKQRRDLVIDNVMRTHSFPAGLKIAGVVYFPPKKKWPDSNRMKALHLTYTLQGKQHRVTVPIHTD